MKNILYICLMLLLATACKQEDSFLYEEKAGLYFYVPELSEGEEEDPDALVHTMNFAEATYVIYNEWNYPTERYYGDSLLVDTVQLVVELLGEISDSPRDYYLKAVKTEGADSLPAADLVFLNPYTMEANASMDTIRVLIPRPKARGHYSVTATFDFSDAAGHFASTLEEQGKFVLNISDRYERPYGWDDATSMFGEFSEEKYAFMVSVLHEPYYNWWEGDTGRLDTLRQALEEYNAAHPDAHKDFTFPEPQGI